MKIRILFFLLGLSLASQHYAQDRAIGHWRAHVYYNNALGVATDGVTLYAISDESFYTYNPAQGELKGYSKADGMSDVKMSCIAYDPVTDMVVLAYRNTNIDLFIHETFYNIPDIRLKSITGSKEIYDIYITGGNAYLSTSFGVVVLDLEKREVKETYAFTQQSQPIPVKRFSNHNGYFYALTANGLYRAPDNSPYLQAFSSWQHIDNRLNYSGITVAGTNLLVSTRDTIFSLTGNLLTPVYGSPYEIERLDSHESGIYVNEYIPSNYSGWIKSLNMDYSIADSFRVMGKPAGVVTTGSIAWVADAYNGLGERDAGGWLNFILPNGPNGFSTYDILPYNKEVWIAHGSVDENWVYQFNRQGLAHLKDDKWKAYDRRNIPELDTTTDYIVLAKDPVDGTIYAGSYTNGMLVLKPDGSYEYYRHNSFLDDAPPDIGSYRVGGITFDHNGNLWILQSSTQYDLIVRTKDGAYHKYSGAGSRNYVAHLIVDDYNQKWYILPRGGVAVYNDNHTPENGNDDSYARLTVADNMPSNTTYCIAKDKDGTIWVGTDDGIGIINCPGEVINGNCQVEKRIVQYDQFAGFLFQGERVKTIAVDGANRKWIGTMNGVWLVSPDGDKIIHRFTIENSPLPANEIQKIAVDPVTGDVYFGTYAGLVSFRSTATDADGPDKGTIITFPNPVPSGYQGTIAIKGLVENADVRITDVSGQLVYRTKALGGQAVWNGLDYTGRRPQSGVYLIFVTNADGTEAATGKMVFME